MTIKKVLCIVTFAMVVASSLRATAGESDETSWPLYFNKPQPYAFTHWSGTCASTQSSKSTDKENGWVWVKAKATVGACSPKCRALVYWHFTPTADQAGKVAIDLSSYSFNVTDIDVMNQGNGTATAEASLWLEVKDIAAEKYARHWVEKEWRAIAGWGWVGGDWDRQTEPLVVNLKEGRTYQIRGALKAQATRGADCSSMGTNCKWGSGWVEAEAIINQVTMYPLERPWISVRYRGRYHSQLAEYDTWNAYEYLDWEARQERYYEDKIYFRVSAGGYDETLSYVDVSLDGDSIMSWTVDPPQLTGTLTQPDVLRFTLPDPETLSFWGGSWHVTVDINPEVDESNLVPCGSMFPVMPLMRDSAVVAACTTWAGVTLDEFYDRSNWYVYLGSWMPVDSALVDGWAWSVTDTGAVRFVGVLPTISLNELFTVGGLGYTEPTLQEIYDEIEARCRGIQATGSSNPIIFTDFSLGENTYTEDRTWTIDAYVQGRADSSHLFDTDYYEMKMHVNFDFYPRYMDPFTGVEEKPVHRDFLAQNYPNPFNPTTTIEFAVRVRGPVTLRVYDVAGRLVKTLVERTMVPGMIHKAIWDGTDDGGSTVATGVYFYRLTTRNSVETKKMVLLK